MKLTLLCLLLAVTTHLRLHAQLHLPAAASKPLAHLARAAPALLLNRLLCCLEETFLCSSTGKQGQEPRAVAHNEHDAILPMSLEWLLWTLLTNHGALE